MLPEKKDAHRRRRALADRSALEPGDQLLEKEEVMPKMIFVNLPVRDLAASTAFYVALGGEVNIQFSGEGATSLMFSDAIRGHAAHP